MNRQEIIQQLNESHRAFIDHILSLSDEEFNYSYEGKWTAGQQLDHIRLSVKPLMPAFILPKFVPKLLFGKANRPSKTYGGLVEKYKSKLEEGAKAPAQFSPKEVPVDKKEGLAKALDALVKNL